MPCEAECASRCETQPSLRMTTLRLAILFQGKLPDVRDVGAFANDVFRCAIDVGAWLPVVGVAKMGPGKAAGYLTKVECGIRDPLNMRWSNVLRETIAALNLRVKIALVAGGITAGT